MLFVVSADIKSKYFGEGSITAEWLRGKFANFLEIKIISIVNEFWKFSDTNLAKKPFLKECEHIFVYFDGAEIYNYEKVTWNKFVGIIGEEPKYIKKLTNENDPAIANFSFAWHEAQSVASRVFREFLGEIKKISAKAKTRSIIMMREQPQFAVGVNMDEITG